ncbi:MAG: hypothetical protein RMJ66_08495, partial [Bacteroidia bacterium]|nr:hypothetical protein [Bacteroidia bacterium]MDW8135086.1 hypothetical protein [Bacteroidia bacterium]
MRWVWIVPLWIWGQGGVPIGQWGVYAYHGNIRSVTYVAPYFWFLSTEGVAILNEETGAYLEMSRANGLVHNRPTALYGDPYARWVFLGYSDGRVQYGPTPDHLVSINDIAANPFYTARGIRDFHTKGDTLAIATDFGIVIWQKSRRRVLATISQLPTLGFADPILRVRWSVGRLWALTYKGIFSLREGMPWNTGWEKHSGEGYSLPDTLHLHFRGWAEKAGKFIVGFRDTLYRWEGDRWEYEPLPSGLEGRRVQLIAGERGEFCVALRDTDVFFFSGQDNFHQQMWNPGPTALWSSPDARICIVASSWGGASVRTPRFSASTETYQRLKASGVTELLPTPHSLYFFHNGVTPVSSGWGYTISRYSFEEKKAEKVDLIFSGRAFYTPAEALWDGNSVWVGTQPGIVRI